MRAITFAGVLALTACGGDKDADTSDTSVEDTTELLRVMRDCPQEAGTICPWAGAGYNGYNGDDVHRLDAWFSFPMGITFHPERPPVMADWNNHKLREILATEEDGFRTIMGTDFLGDGDPDLLDSTPAGAPGTSVNLNHPTQHIWLPDGMFLSASWHTHKLRTWDPETGLVRVYLGGAPGFAGTELDEPADMTQLNQPKEVMLSPADSNLLYILDMRNERVRRLDRTSWTVDTIAGNGEKCLAADGVSTGDDGDAMSACFGFPKNDNPEPGGALEMSDDGTTVYIADSENHYIRALDLETGVITSFAGAAGESGDVDGGSADARFYYPVDLELDEANGVMYVADANNHKIRVIDMASGAVSTFAGTGDASCELDRGLLIPEICDNTHDGGDGGPATEASLYRPFAVTLDLDGNVIISDTYRHRVRVVYK
jgi:hypothetical protein